MMPRPASSRAMARIECSAVLSTLGAAEMPNTLAQGLSILRQPVQAAAVIQ